MSRMRIERSLGTKRTIEGENRILEWFVEERGRRGKESCVKWNRMKDGKRREWGERMMWKGMNGKNDERMNENGVE